MKLWQKDDELVQNELAAAVEKFTVGKDRLLDEKLAAFDILGSIAHTRMLASTGILPMEKSNELISELKNIYQSVARGEFVIEDGVEDVHSQVEQILTKKLGDAGKMIHNARSRNDQVLVDIRLFLRSELELLAKKVNEFFDLLLEQSDKFKDHMMPGYTHLQIAMPSSFGLWFGAYAESLTDDVITIRAAYDIVNKNPLGSAAGYGSSFAIDRRQTTQLLGFEDLNYNSIYAQMGRGKTERIVAQSISNVADSLQRLSMDACLFSSQNFAFISFPEDLTTGSSIMPHKKNPDVFELIRGHCNRIKALPNEIAMMTTNLPSGYHRDLQLLKEHLFHAIETLMDCLDMAMLMLANVIVRKDILDDERYDLIFSVEEVNKLVMQGMPFRDAYKKVGIDIGMGHFVPDKKIRHTHEGSIGNLCNDEIREVMKKLMNSFPFEKVNRVLGELVK